MNCNICIEPPVSQGAIFRRIFSGVALAGFAFIAAGVQAQTTNTTMTPAEAQMRYERRLAVCNAGTLPAPDRQACVRNAGEMFDSERAGQRTPPPMTTTDGRATVMSSPPLPMNPAAPGTSTSGTTSTDGRATIIAPSTIPQQ